VTGLADLMAQATDEDLYRIGCACCALLGKADWEPYRPLKLEEEFAARLQAEVIDPWRRRIVKWLRGLGDRTPSAKALPGLLKQYCLPDQDALRKLLSEMHLAAANVGGQRALDKLVAARGKAAVARDRLAKAADIPGFNLRNPEMLAQLATRGERITGEVTQTMLNDLHEVLLSAFVQGNLTPRAVTGAIGDIFPSTYAGRAENIARSEIGQAQGLLTTETYRMNGVEKQEWLSSTDACEDCAAADGQIVGIDELFEVGGEMCEASAAHPRCECDSLPVFDDSTDVPEELWTGE
jgi:hypothetical protein